MSLFKDLLEKAQDFLAANPEKAVAALPAYYQRKIDALRSKGVSDKELKKQIFACRESFGYAREIESIALFEVKARALYCKGIRKGLPRLLLQYGEDLFHEACMDSYKYLEDKEQTEKLERWNAYQTHAEQDYASLPAFYQRDIDITRSKGLKYCIENEETDMFVFKESFKIVKALQSQEKVLEFYRNVGNQFHKAKKYIPTLLSDKYNRYIFRSACVGAIYYMNEKEGKKMELPDFYQRKLDDMYSRGVAKEEIDKQRFIFQESTKILDVLNTKIDVENFYRAYRRDPLRASDWIPTVDSIKYDSRTLGRICLCAIEYAREKESSKKEGTPIKAVTVPGKEY